MIKTDILKQSCYPIAFITAITGVSTQIVNILTILIFLDILTGITKSYRLYGGTSIRSGRLSGGILSKLVVILIPLILALAGKGIGIDLTELVKGSFGTLILAETYSNFSNINQIRTGVAEKEFDVVSKLLEQIKKIILALLDNKKP